MKTIVKKSMVLLTACFAIVLTIASNAKAAEKGYESEQTSGDWTYRVITMDDIPTTNVEIVYSGTGRAVTVPDTIEGYTVTELGYSAFYDNRETLLSVDATAATHLEIIGSDACYNCSKLVSFTYNTASVKEIGVNAFYNCEKLQSFTLPTNTEFYQIKEDVFRGCAALSSISIGTNIQVIDEGAFYGSGLTSCVVPDNVDTMGTSVFYDCKKLQSVTLSQHEYLTQIPAYTFGGCEALKTIQIPANYTSIGSSAFQNADLLYMVIPATVTEFEENAFCYSSIEYLQFLGNTPPTMSGEDQLYGTTKLKSILTPVGCKQAYMDAFSVETVSTPESVAYGESSVTITTFPQPSTEYGKTMTVAGTLYEGATVSTISISGVFVDAVTGAEVPGTLSWTEPNMKYERGYCNVKWSFTPTSNQAIPVNGEIRVSVEEVVSNPGGGAGNGTGTGTGTGSGTGTGTGVGTTGIGTTTTTTTNIDQVVLTDQQKNIVTTTTTQLVKPKKPTIKSIKVKGKKLVVTWKKKIKGASGYQIYLSTKKSSGFKLKTSVKGYKKASGTVKGIKKGKTYYVKVRTYKQVNGIRAYSKYSAVKKIVVK